MQRSDMEIQRDVVDELRWEPSVRDDDVAVAVREGVVTLAGFVDSFADKWRAESVVSKVRGVKGIANEVEVKLPSLSTRTDPALARAALDALKWDVSVPEDRIKVKVEKGWLTLEGDVEWYYQRAAAERAVRRLTGLKGVSNALIVRVRPVMGDVKQRIKDSLQRWAQFDADRITVEIAGNKAILRGAVRSYAEKRDAEWAARRAPGVTEVDNRLNIETGVYAAV
jgi:osmotically-inducible protein OsmY